MGVHQGRGFVVVEENLWDYEILNSPNLLPEDVYLDLL